MRSKHENPFKVRPTLPSSVGLFACLSLQLWGVCPTYAGSTSFKLPKVTFFWQQPEFRNKDADPESQAIDPFPEESLSRIEQSSVFDTDLVTQDSGDRRDFQTQYIAPLTSFIEASDPTPDDSEQETLPLREALVLALSSNNAIQIRDLQIAVENEHFVQAESVFIPSIELSSEYSQSRYPQNASEASANNLFPQGGEPRRFLSKTGLLEAALVGENAIGTQYELYTNLRYNESTLTRTSLSAIYEEEFTSNLGFRLTQPILRDSSRRIREAPIRIARRNQEIAEAELITELTELSARTMEAYFRWLEAQEIVGLRSWERSVYEKLAETVRERVETGDASIRESLRIEIRLTRADDRILQAKEQVDLAREQLFSEFGFGELPSKYEAAIPTGELSPFIPSVNAETISANALANSAEVQRFRNQVEISKENLGIAKDESRPNLAFVSGVELRGLNNGPDTSYRDLASDQPVGYNVGLVYSRPWDNASADARVRETRLLLLQSEIDLKRISHEIRRDIELEVERLELLSKRQTNIRRLQEKIGEEIEQENERLEIGQTSLSSLLEFYEELFQIRSQYLNILTQINESKVRLWTIDQSLLRRIGIDYRSSLAL